MEILYLPKVIGISEREMIFTSGDGDTLPPGLLVGIVKKVDKSGKVTVAMVENINNLNMVTVIEY
jgi:cell shape-determining protein MreC